MKSAASSAPSWSMSSTHASQSAGRADTRTPWPYACAAIGVPIAVNVTMLWLATEFPSGLMPMLGIVPGIRCFGAMLPVIGLAFLFKGPFKRAHVWAMAAVYLPAMYSAIRFVAAVFFPDILLME